MKLYRFFVDGIRLEHNFWLHDEELLDRWNKELRFRPGQQVVLLDGATHERLYKIDEIGNDEAHLVYMTDLEPKLPNKNVYLLWSLLKKDQNEWVLQKCTELGVSHFLPLITDRSEKTGFDHEQAEKVVREAAEQCGRSDIPTVREPMHTSVAIEQLQDKVDLYICEQDGVENLGVLVGPEGGWSDAERELFKEKGLRHLNIHDFTLRAEAAAVTAAGKLIQ